MINERHASAFCNEDISKIENYKQAVNDKTQTWHCHHLLEIQGQFRNSKALLKKCGLYYNVPASQLIFLTPEDHKRIHCVGTHLSEETRKKLSCAKLGDKNPNFGKHLSEETRKKLSLSNSGKPSWNKGKSLSEETKKKISMSLSGKHRSEETTKKCAEAIKGTHWWNNGIVSKQKRECPGQGWVRGRIKFLRKTK